MTRHDILSQELYRLSVGLEKHNVSFASHRNTLICTLSAMEYLVSCIRKDTISNDQAHIIINTLETILNKRYFDFASGLLTAESNVECLPNQQELLFEVSGAISLCIGELCSRDQNYAESVRRYIAVIQAIVRALLPDTHAAWLSAEEAARMTRTSLKCD